MIKLPKWTYPKDAVSIKYWGHLFILVIVLEMLWLITGSLFPQLFSFSMPPLSFNLIKETILSSMTLVLVALVGFSDIVAHSILKIN